MVFGVDAERDVLTTDTDQRPTPENPKNKPDDVYKDIPVKVRGGNH